jgi:hypothetical protein
VGGPERRATAARAAQALARAQGAGVARGVAACERKRAAPSERRRAGVRVWVRDWQRWSGARDREQRGRVWRTSEAVEEKATDEVRQHCELLVENRGGLARMVAEGTALMQTDHDPRGGGGAVMAWRAGRRGGEAKAATGCHELGGARCSQAQRAPFTHVEVGAGVTRHGFDAQRKTGGGGRPALMAAQQVERAAELQDPEVRAELDRCVRGCERECSAGGRLCSIPQACARARQQATREQVKGQGYGSYDQARRPCEWLRKQAGHALAAHVRE